MDTDRLLWLLGECEIEWRGGSQARLLLSTTRRADNMTALRSLRLAPVVLRRSSGMPLFFLVVR